MDKKELRERVKADDVKFISLQFTDVTGAVKASISPPTAWILPWKMESGSMAPLWKALPASRRAICA